MRLAIIIPAYNEEQTIKELLRRIQSINLQDLDIEKELIVVDDGSTDKTKEIIKRDFPQTLLISNPSCQGKGSAIRRALEYANAEMIIFQDADLEYDPQEYPRLLKPILNGKAEVVYGSRFLSTTYPPRMLVLNYLGNLIGTFLVNLLYGAHLTDLMTCYKVLPCRVLKGISLKCSGFDICAEITAKLLKRGIRIYEVPISYQGRTHQAGKKIGLRDSWFILLALFKYRFRN